MYVYYALFYFLDMYLLDKSTASVPLIWFELIFFCTKYNFHGFFMGFFITWPCLKNLDVSNVVI